MGLEPWLVASILADSWTTVAVAPEASTMS
jgi:hypothetical protein